MSAEKIWNQDGPKRIQTPVIVVDVYGVGTHGLIKLFIAAMAYYINTPDSQSSGRGRCRPNYFKVGDLF